jgi:hypothetical protein
MDPLTITQVANDMILDWSSIIPDGNGDPVAGYAILIYNPSLF